MSSGCLVNVYSSRKWNKEHMDKQKCNDHFRTGFGRWKTWCQNQFRRPYKCFLSEVNNTTFGGHWETTRSTRKTLDLNSTELYCMLQASFLHYQFFVIWMNARSSYFSGLLSGEFVLSVDLVMNMLLYAFSTQEFHNGLTLMDSSNILTQVNQ